MLLFPHAKINLGLNVIARRADGFHEIESVLFPIPLHDALEIVVAPELTAGTVVYTRSGLSIPGDPNSDLCMRAVELVQQVQSLPGLRMHLHKVIPMGAGLGGGSSDGAHVLLLLERLLDLGMTPVAQHDLASQLGSDCPYFLQADPALVSGRGEVLTPITLDLKGTWLVLVNPGLHVSTAEVYRNTDPTGASMGLADLPTDHRPETWQGSVSNSMEHYVFLKHPEVAAIKQRLLDAGALYASMSGSGSTVFGIFNTPPPLIEWPSSHEQWTFTL